MTIQPMKLSNAFLFTSLLLPLTACGGSSYGQEDDHDHANPFEGIETLVCVLRPTEGNTTSGTVTFAATDAGVAVTADVRGLEPGGTHAIHVHEFGDLRSADGTSLGGHYNPEGHDHGLPEQDARHAGDLGNLVADDEGRARYTITIDNATLVGERNPILGRGVVVHAEADDGGQPVGNAGPRIAVGVIGVAQP